ncbi:imidazole glycerol phosphate synthase subunit HisF [bacterium]|jgi:imidazole glycerol-phosphate synthase subunit HisF|nr:imidazole glycerol phosphate synthase subunit HisF [bacterium]
MLTKRIIPCLDVANGRVVKGTNFVNLVDAGDPVELALRYDKEGADELVFLDITASSDKRAILIEFVKKTAEVLFIPFTVGGGINDCETIRDLLLAGADKVSINTAAVRNPDLIREASVQFGNQCIVVAVDARRIRVNSVSEYDFNYDISHVAVDSQSVWEVYTHGGRKPTGIDAVKWAMFMNECGAGEILLTSMDSDGTKDGYDISLTKKVSDSVTIPVIASGGAGTLDHIADVLDCCDAALLASLLHYRMTTVDEIKNHCQSKSVRVRI